MTCDVAMIAAMIPPGQRCRCGAAGAHPMPHLIRFTAAVALVASLLQLHGC